MTLLVVALVAEQGNTGILSQRDDLFMHDRRTVREVTEIRFAGGALAATKGIPVLPRVAQRPFMPVCDSRLA